MQSESYVKVGGTPFGVALRQLAMAHPDRPALTCGEVTLTRLQLIDRSDYLAELFAEHGVTSGSTVAIVLPNSVGLIQSIIAAWQLGAIPLPISHIAPSLERDAIVHLADPTLLVGVSQSEAGNRRTLEFIQDDLQPSSNSALRPTISPQWKMMTSGGSTGRPKLILTTQPGVLESVAAASSIFRIPTGGPVLVTGPLSHNGPFLTATLALLFGDHVLLMPRFDAAETLSLVETYGVNWLYLVPTMMQRIWRLPEDLRWKTDVSSLKVAFHMGAPCAHWLKEAWIGWLGPERVLELYAGTEGQAATVITGSEWLRHRGSVGRPAYGELDVRDSTGQHLAPYKVGEIWLRPSAARAPRYKYIGAEPKRADDRWESLGDMGYFDNDGYIYITDRSTDMFLVGGANVYPAEIEAALDEHPAVRSSCAIGLPDDDLGNVPHAIVELAQPVSDDELRDHLGERLASYKLPRTFERVTTPLRDEAGKVRRSGLRAERLTATPMRSTTPSENEVPASSRRAVT